MGVHDGPEYAATIPFYYAFFCLTLDLTTNEFQKHTSNSSFTPYDQDISRFSCQIYATVRYSRVADRSISRISDWEEYAQTVYELHDKRPTLKHIEFNKEEANDTKEGTERDYKSPSIKDHRELSVRSVIDVHAWDQARWKGTAYAQFSTYYPPCVAFMFENEEAARNIFKRWRNRFGNQDKNEEIHLSIIRELPRQNKHHYCVQISSKLPDAEQKNTNKLITMATRTMTMTPDSDNNLERFLESYNHFGSFYLMPAVLNQTGEPELLYDLSILKHDITIRKAASVGKHDIEAIALQNAEESENQD